MINNHEWCMRNDKLYAETFFEQARALINKCHNIYAALLYFYLTFKENIKICRDPFMDVNDSDVYLVLIISGNGKSQTRLINVHDIKINRLWKKKYDITSVFKISTQNEIFDIDMKTLIQIVMENSNAE